MYRLDPQLKAEWGQHVLDLVIRVGIHKGILIKASSNPTELPLGHVGEHCLSPKKHSSQEMLCNLFLVNSFELYLKKPQSQRV